MMDKVFADTSYFLSLLNGDDPEHEAAVEYAALVGDQLLTTEWVLAELANGLSSPPNRQVAAEFIRDLRDRPAVTIMPADSEGFAAGLDLYSARPDKGWSLIDCISFLAMEREGIAEALTADHHFEQAGFVALLKSR